MARICEGGAIAQSDFVLGQVVFSSGLAALNNLEAFKFAHGHAVDNMAPVSETHSRDTQAFSTEQAAPVAEGHALDGASPTPPGDAVPVSSQLVITNT